MDTEGVEGAEEYYDDEGHEEDYDEGFSDAENGAEEMTEEEAFNTYQLATALGLGEEVGLEEADLMRSIQLTDDLTKKKKKDAISIKEIKGKTFRAENTSEISTLTGKLKCPFEQWIKDVCAGRKSVHDPVGGEDYYDSEY